MFKYHLISMEDEQNKNKNNSLPLISDFEIDDQLKVRAFYDTYDYASFWAGRDYEKQADALAVLRLLALIKGPRKKIIDVGVGIGRMVPLYEKH